MDEKSEQMKKVNVNVWRKSQKRWLIGSKAWKDEGRNEKAGDKRKGGRDEIKNARKRSYEENGRKGKLRE